MSNNDHDVIIELIKLGNDLFDMKRFGESMTVSKVISYIKNLEGRVEDRGIVQPGKKEDTFYMVFNPKRGPARIPHLTYLEASTEAHRLAAKHPGEPTYILKAVNKILGVVSFHRETLKGGSNEPER